MNVADRIQTLRRSRGISQEELAYHVGVSRQAVSKWESEQSLPDIDRIVLLSEYFGVTTDYLLRGIEELPGKAAKAPNALLFAVGGALLNAAGLITAIALWVERQDAYAAAVGLAIMLAGIFFFSVGQLINAREKERARLAFFMGSVWSLPVIPASLLFNLGLALLAKGGWLPAPLPSLVSGFPMLLYGLFWLVYFGGCSAVDWVLYQRWKQG